MDVEGLSLEEWRALSIEQRNALIPLGRAITFRIGTATVLAEADECGGVLIVNLAQIDGGGEGVLLRLWKLIATWALERGCTAIRWNVFAATCVDPNPRLQQFLRSNGFDEIDDPSHGRIFARTTELHPTKSKVR